MALYGTSRTLAKEFRLSNKEATNIINEVSVAVAKWRNVANKLKIPKIPKIETERMASAFEY